MTVKPNKQIFIELDGKQHELRFTWKALCLLEREVGLQFSDLAIQMERGSIGFSRITQILWATLSHEDNPLSILKLEDILDTKKMEEYADLIVEAFGVAFPDKEEEDDKGKNEKGQKTKNGLSKDTSKQVTE